MKNISTSKLLFALLLSAVGVILLLVNIGVISLEIKNIFHNVYPFLFFILGLIWCYQGFSSRRKRRIFWGLFFIVFASFLIADRFGYVTFGFWDIFKLWPFLLIYFGIQMLFGKKKIVKVTITNDKKQKNEEKTIIDSEFDDFDLAFSSEFHEDNRKKEKKNNLDVEEILQLVNQHVSDEAIREKIQEKLKTKYAKKTKEEYRQTDGDNYMGNDNEPASYEDISKRKASSNNTDINVFGMSIGDIEYKKTNWSLEPMKLQHMIANYYFDFSKAFIPEGETPVTLKGRVGDITILIPEDIPVKISVKNAIGNVELFGQDSPNVGSGRVYYYESDNYADATRKINLTIHLSIGSVEINQV
ncbi:cell wall-active antibiotics response protein LiaF [Caldibacillus lycopersici]|uniref:Cell wall-active antibiotics response protein LiaF n=1 Tax=Perspicuibacillus lycopersici TaxID=1325689 RepID=A0AAE3ISB9_9BACI|nr:cell wall-active antibiotics response protein LiaF [Perspicuibacillus lycopersici]MCU9612501.1 cell wall-active antibiotics response protein LiaF [Perspicuibacillus lycopersici]